MNKKKFVYKRYDYSCLTKNNKFYGYFIPTVRKVFARTIGLDLATVKPMNKPLGTLYWIDSKI